MAMKWSITTLAQLYRRLDIAMEEYEAYCHQAAAEVAPRNSVWIDEAAWAVEARQRLRMRTTDWIEYATNRNLDTLRRYDD
jgi:hypothetical protein